MPPDIAVNTADEAWQPLPPRAQRLFALTDALVLAPMGAAGGWFLADVGEVLLPQPPLAGLLAGLVLGFIAGLLSGRHRFRHTRWRLDANGFTVARGRWWRRETLVPATRVQHLDLKHGPLERHWGLATLVIHTAGTRDNAVSLSGLAQAEAERLRETLARQPEDDDGAV